MSKKKDGISSKRGQNQMFTRKIWTYFFNVNLKCCTKGQTKLGVHRKES